MQLQHKFYQNISIIHSIKQLVIYAVLTLVSLDQMAYKSQSSAIISYNIYQTLKLLVTRVVLTLVTLDQMAYKSVIS